MSPGELPFEKKQEVDSEPLGHGKILQVVQETHRAQRNKVTRSVILNLIQDPLEGASYNGSTFLSKRKSVGSIPTAPAKKPPRD